MDSHCPSPLAGGKSSINRDGQSAKPDDPLMSKMHDDINKRCGKPDGENHNLTVKGSFPQPWDR